MKKEKRDMAFDLLKIISAVAVIIIHMSSYVLTTRGTNTIYFKISNFYATIMHFSVPIFIMITGAFLLSKKEELPLKKIYKKYILKTFIIFILATLFYKITSMYQNNITLTINNIFNILIQAIFGNSEVHLWYLYMLIGLYMLYPIIYKFIKSSNKKTIEYTLIILFILSSLIFSLSELSIITGITVASRLNISIYIFYFLAGYYLYTYDLTKIKSLILLILLPISMIGTYLLSTFATLKLRSFNLIFVEYSSVNIVILSLGMFYLFKLISKKINPTKTLTEIIYIISKLTLGVYIIHMFIMDYIYKLNIINFRILTNVYLIPLYSIIIFIISALATYIVKTICKILKLLYKNN